MRKGQRFIQMLVRDGSDPEGQRTHSVTSANKNNFKTSIFHTYGSFALYLADHAVFRERFKIVRVCTLWQCLKQ